MWTDFTCFRLYSLVEPVVKYLLNLISSPELHVAWRPKKHRGPPGWLPGSSYSEDLQVPIAAPSEYGLVHADHKVLTPMWHLCTVPFFIHHLLVISCGCPTLFTSTSPIQMKHWSHILTHSGFSLLAKPHRRKNTRPIITSPAQMCVQKHWLASFIPALSVVSLETSISQSEM